MENRDEKIKDFFSKSAKVTKSAFEKASSAVQSFSDTSIAKIERTQLKSSRQKKYAQLGELLSTLLLEKGADITALGKIKKDSNDSVFQDIQKLQKEIVGLTKDIKERDKNLADKKK